MRAHIALGSNLPLAARAEAGGAGGGYRGGPAASTPRGVVAAALAAVDAEPDVRLVRASSIYRTEPVGLREQPDFANAVAEVETDLAPEDLLDRLLALERAFGRTRAERNAPRTLDLDLLLMGDAVRHGPRLTLPHPRLHERRFVLVPLAEIAADVLHPVLGRTAGELLRALQDPARLEPWGDEAAEGGGSGGRGIGAGRAAQRTGRQAREAHARR